MLLKYLSSLSGLGYKKHWNSINFCFQNMKAIIPKWLLTDSYIYFILAITTHIILIFLFINFFSHNNHQPVRPTFQTAVVFESVSEIKNPIETSSISRGPKLSNTFDRLDNLPSLIQRKQLKKGEKTISSNRDIKPRLVIPKHIDNFKKPLRKTKNKNIPQVVKPIAARESSVELRKPIIVNKNQNFIAKNNIQINESKTNSKLNSKKSIVSQQNRSSKTDSKDRFSKLWKKRNDLLAYRNKLGKLISANWVIPPVSVKIFQIIVEANIDSNGNLIGTKFNKRSNLVILDAAAIKAIRVSIPFPKFPASFDPEKRSFKAVFRFTPESVTP